MLKLRWAASCRVCSRSLPAGTRAHWDASTRLVTCVQCALGAAKAVAEPVSEPAAKPAAERIAASEPAATSLDRGSPGASAEREYVRRRRNREARTRARHPHLGGLLLALGGTPQHERAFRRGGAGERTVARSLERRTAKGPAVILHDRRMPGGRGNIDHLAIAPRGVYVIDAKAIKGKVRVWRPVLRSPKLLVNGRARNNLVAGLDRQVAAVHAALDAAGHGDVAITSVFCFTEAELPLFGMQIDGRLLAHPRALARKLRRKGPLTAEAIDLLAQTLASAFPPA
jgi:Nuclease-related domain